MVHLQVLYERGGGIPYAAPAFFHEMKKMATGNIESDKRHNGSSAPAYIESIQNGEGAGIIE